MWRTWVQSLVWDNSTCHRTTRPTHCSYWVCELWNPWATTGECASQNESSHVLQATKTRHGHINKQFLKNQVWKILKSQGKASGHFGKTLSKQALGKQPQKINYLMNHWLITGEDIYKLKSSGTVLLKWLLSEQTDRCLLKYSMWPPRPYDHTSRMLCFH